MILEDLFENDSPVQYHLARPANINPSLLTDIADLIVAGAEVPSNQVQRNLQQAVNIVWASDHGRTMGVVVLKRPIPSYKDYVFQSAGVANQAQHYNQELGYVYVLPKYRAQGVGAKMLRIMNRNVQQPVFATTRENNRTINTILKWAKFDVTGDPWASSRGNYRIMLWTRDR